MWQEVNRKGDNGIWMESSKNISSFYLTEGSGTKQWKKKKKP